ncbi:MAG: symmetrical bis(5'-nucleosyl)-tetraphosphatase [Magnetococcus sp. DMHC-6]
MALYAIGDLHGCLQPLQELLKKINFSYTHDHLWFVGDLINRGPDSIKLLQFVQEMGDRAISLMGNHEIRAIMALCDHRAWESDPHMAYLQKDPSARSWLEWLRRRPLLHQEPKLGLSMVHAGLYPFWSLEDARVRARNLEEIFLDTDRCHQLLSKDGPPLLESESLSLPGSLQRHRFDLAVFTRIRMTTSEGLLLWPQVGVGSDRPNPYLLPSPNSPYLPWHQVRAWQPSEQVVYGHWAAAGLTVGPHHIGLDSGCVYGGKLTAIRLDDPQRPVFQVECPQYATPDLEYFVK